MKNLWIVPLLLCIQVHAETIGESQEQKTYAPRAKPYIVPSCPTANNEANFQTCLKTPNKITAAAKTRQIFRKVAAPTHKRAEPGNPADEKKKLEAFKSALKSQIKACSRVPGTLFKMKFEEKGKIHDQVINRRDFCVTSNTRLQDLANEPDTKSVADVMAKAGEEFDWYKSDCKDEDNAGEVQFTAYYSPTIEGRRRPDETYKYPLYKLPKDLKVVKQVVDGKEVSRVCMETGGEVVCPYPPRKEIENGHLEGKNLEMFYVKDLMDVTLAQVQGSLTIEEADGKLNYVNYANKNGNANYMPARIARCMCGKEEEWNSIPAVRKFFAEKFGINTLAEREALDLNPSYVFFEEGTTGPFGGSGQKLTPFHSLAVDDTVYPYGMVTIYDAKLPGQKSKTSTLALAQDTGGAIKGCHVDIYVGEGGEGSEATTKAGNMNAQGSLIFALPKGTTSKGLDI